MIMVVVSVDVKPHVSDRLHQSEASLIDQAEAAPVAARNGPYQDHSFRIIRRRRGSFYHSTIERGRGGGVTRKICAAVQIINFSYVLEFCLAVVAAAAAPCKMGNRENTNA